MESKGKDDILKEESKIRVLIVEDDKKIRETYCQLINETIGME